MKTETKFASGIVGKKTMPDSLSARTRLHLILRPKLGSGGEAELALLLGPVDWHTSRNSSPGRCPLLVDGCPIESTPQTVDPFSAPITDVTLHGERRIAHPLFSKEPDQPSELPGAIKHCDARQHLLREGPCRHQMTREDQTTGHRTSALATPRALRLTSNPRRGPHSANLRHELRRMI